MTTTTALPTLTDQELNSVQAYHFVEVRRVEDAVHAKLLPYFAQREREAERAAWNAAVINQRGVLTHASCKARDSLYPSLTPQPSREIMLSNHDTYRRVDGKWQWASNSGRPSFYQGPWQEIAGPKCFDAADHDKCAELLRLEEQ